MLLVVGRSRIDGRFAGYSEIRRRRHGENDRAQAAKGAVRQDLGHRFSDGRIGGDPRDPGQVEPGADR